MSEYGTSSNPHKHGIRVDESQTPHGYGLFNINISPSIGRFLTDIAGEGGRQDDWTLYALGVLMWMCAPCN